MTKCLIWPFSKAKIGGHVTNLWVSNEQGTKAVIFSFSQKYEEFEINKKINQSLKGHGVRLQPGKTRVGLKRNEVVVVVVVWLFLRWLASKVTKTKIFRESVFRNKLSRKKEKNDRWRLYEVVRESLPWSLDRVARELREVRMNQTWSNRVGHFDYNNFSFKSIKRSDPNQSNRTSMLQAYLP